MRGRQDGSQCRKCSDEFGALVRTLHPDCTHGAGQHPQCLGLLHLVLMSCCRHMTAHGPASERFTFRVTFFAILKKLWNRQHFWEQLNRMQQAPVRKSMQLVRQASLRSNLSSRAQPCSCRMLDILQPAKATTVAALQFMQLVYFLLDGWSLHTAHVILVCRSPFSRLGAA